jgi:hypothetical protein
LAYFYSGFGDGVEAACGEAFVAVEEAVDGVVLFDVAAGELEVDEGSDEADALGAAAAAGGGGRVGVIVSVGGG